eukprot:194759_1
MLCTLFLQLIFTLQYTSAFNPKDVPDLMFFIESIHGLAVANCNNNTCDNSGDNAELALQFCNLEKFPYGCVRRWEDQGPYNGAAEGHPFEPPEWIHGRDFGQDDHEKPGYIPNCINGLPCVRGCQELPQRGWPQNCSFEIEHFNTFELDSDLSIFHLARQVPQPVDNFLFGVHGLKHNVAKLALEIPSPDIQISIDNAMPFNKWVLIEIHRNSAFAVECYINKTDKTISSGVIVTRPISTGHYLSKYKGAGASFGDFALSIVYNRILTETERVSIRDYIYNIYFNNAFDKTSVASQIPPQTTATTPQYSPPKHIIAPTLVWEKGGCDNGCDSGWVAPPLYYFSETLNENVIVSCARSVRAIKIDKTTYWERDIVGAKELYYGCNYNENIGIVAMNKNGNENAVRIYNKMGSVIKSLIKTEECCEWRSLTLATNINPSDINAWYIIVGRTKSDLQTWIYDTSFNLQSGWPQLDYSMNSGNSWG